MFKQISEQFKKGSMTLTVQVEEDSMAVMINFKGIDLAPKVLRGSPEEIDNNFMKVMTQPMNLVSNYNEQEYLVNLQKELEAKSKKLESENKEAEKKKKEETKKKVDEAKAAQTTLLDAVPEAPKKVEKPAPAPVVKKETKEDFKTKPLTEDEINLLKTHLEADTPDPWEAYEFCSKIIAQIRGIKPEEAIDLVNASSVVVEYNKPKEDPHEKNVKALKKAMEQEPEEDFVFDQVETVSAVTIDEDDDFEL